MEIKDGRGFIRGTVSAAKALQLARVGQTTFYGVGNRNRIRFLRATSGKVGFIAEDSTITIGRWKERANITNKNALNTCRVIVICSLTAGEVGPSLKPKNK